MIQIIFILALCFIALYVLGLFTKDNSKVDVFWGLGFIIIAWGIYTSGTNMSLSHWAIVLLVTAWGLRLGYNITKKQLKHGGEDFRYANWRENWDHFYIRSFFQIHVLQFVLMCLVATPIFVMYNGFASDNMLLLILGFGVSAFGLVYETIADRQLAEFIKTKKKGEILTSGLRKYHRYPQYFGESVFWMGVAIIASQVSLWAFFGAILITLLVRYVSGVPILEKRYQGDKAYEKYSKKTPVFIPDWRK